MDKYYSDKFLSGLGLRPNTEVAYYWVEDDRIQYWNFTDDGWLPYTGSQLLQVVCDALNAHTKEHYSHRFRDYYECNPNSLQCYLIQGGPLDGHCLIDDEGELHTLPADAFDVLGLPVSEVVVMPDHDLWELMWEGVHYRYPSINVYLLVEGREDGSMGGGNYTVHMECGKPVVVSNDRVGTRVHVGSLNHCLSLEGHMREVFDAGKKLVADRLRDTIMSLVGKEV
jgi:hypothetical protein